MTKERLKSPRLRLFLALDLPPEVRQGLDRWRRRALGKRPEIRLPAAETLHVTLAFLGYQAEKDLQRIEAAAFGGPAVAAAGPAQLRIEGFRPLPSRRPRLFAADLADLEGALGPVQEEASQRLAAARFYEPEKRPFWPHVTFARVKQGREREAAAAQLPKLPAALRESFFAVRLTLYVSLLSRQGAEYRPLAQRELDRD